MERLTRVLRLVPPLLLLAGYVAAAPVTVREEQGLVVVENQWARYTVDPAHGARISAFTWKADGTQWCYGGVNSGLFLDHVWQQAHPGELQNAAYLYEIVERGPERVVLKAHGEIRLQNDDTISGVTVSKALTFFADRPAVQVTVTLGNPTGQVKRPGWWQQHCFQPGGEETDVYHFRPGTTGLNPATYRQEAGRWLTRGAEWVKDPVAGWTGTVNAPSRDGAVFLMDYNYLRWLYNCLPCWTTEYFYDRVALPTGREWTTEQWFLPVQGYGGFSHADRLCLGYVLLEGNKLTVQLGAALAETGPAQVKLEVLSYPEQQPVKTEEYKLERLTWTPVAHSLELAAPLPVGLLVKVQVTVGEQSSRFESYQAPGSNPYEIVPGRVVYRVAKPAKQKQYYFPASAPAFPEKPAVLFLKGPQCDDYRLEEAARLLGAEVKKGYYESNVYGNRLDYVPATVEEMFAYRVVALGNLDFEAIGEDLAAYLRYYVEHGGGLLVLAGANSFGRGEYAGTALEPLLPATTSDPWSLRLLPSPARLRPATAAPLLRGVDWSAGPVTCVLQGTGCLPGQRVLVSAGGEPFLVTRYLGGGKVAAVLGPPLGTPREGTAYWEWRDWPRLLANLLEWLGK